MTLLSARSELAARTHGDLAAPRTPIVLLHGLTFDRTLWEPVIDALAPDQPAIAFDLPAHGDSPPLPAHELQAVVEALYRAVQAAGLRPPVMVGHSIGAVIAAIYASAHPTAGLVTVDQSLRTEAHLRTVAALEPQLRAEFAAMWPRFAASMHQELVPEAARAALKAGEDVRADVVLDYWFADLGARSVDGIVQLTDDTLKAIRDAGVPFLALHGRPVDAADRRWLADRVPGADVVTWPVGHHFPHLADPVAFADVLACIAQHGISRNFCRKETKCHHGAAHGCSVSPSLGSTTSRRTSGVHRPGEPASFAVRQASLP